MSSLPSMHVALITLRCSQARSALPACDLQLSSYMQIVLDGKTYNSK